MSGQFVRARIGWLGNYLETFLWSALESGIFFPSGPFECPNRFLDSAQQCINLDRFCKGGVRGRGNEVSERTFYSMSLLVFAWCSGLSTSMIASQVTRRLWPLKVNHDGTNWLDTTNLLAIYLNLFLELFITSIDYLGTSLMQTGTLQMF